MYGILLDPKDVPAELRDCFEEIEVECGAPWRRVVERTAGERDDAGRTKSLAHQRMGKAAPPERGWEARKDTIGWQPTCKCNRTDTVPAVVLDPFSGAGTTALVALRLGRRALGIELNPEYIAMSHKRIQGDPQAMNMRMTLEELAG